MLESLILLISLFPLHQTWLDGNNYGYFDFFPDMLVTKRIEIGDFYMLASWLTLVLWKLNLNRIQSPPQYFMLAKNMLPLQHFKEEIE